METARAFAELAVTPGENLHITLEFLGELDDDAVARARDAVVETARATPGASWHAIWTEPGVFPQRSRPRVLWLGVDDGDHRLAAAHTTLQAELRSRTLPVEERRFRPHLTLARIRQRSLSGPRAEEILRFLESAPVPAPTNVRSLKLYRSILGRGPAVHEPLLEVPFA